MQESYCHIGFIRSAFYLFQEALRMGDYNYISAARAMIMKLIEHAPRAVIVDLEKEGIIEQINFINGYMALNNEDREEFLRLIESYDAEAVKAIN